MVGHIITAYGRTVADTDLGMGDPARRNHFLFPNTCIYILYGSLVGTAQYTTSKPPLQPTLRNPVLTVCVHSGRHKVPLASEPLIHILELC